LVKDNDVIEENYKEIRRKTYCIDRYDRTSTLPPRTSWVLLIFDILLERETLFYRVL